MKTKIINFSKTFRAIDAWLDEYNQGKGSREQVKLGERVLAKELCKIYTAMLSKRKSVHLATGELPSLRTNNVQLSKRVYKSPRTVQSYLKKLGEAGVIVNKVWHGSNSSYEVWLNTGLLNLQPNNLYPQTTFTATDCTIPSVYQPPSDTIDSTPVPSFPEAEIAIDPDFSKKQKFPHTDNLSSKENTINNIIIAGFPVNNESTCTEKTDNERVIDDERCGKWKYQSDFSAQNVEKAAEFPGNLSKDVDKQAVNSVDNSKKAGDCRTKTVKSAEKAPKKHGNAAQSVSGNSGHSADQELKKRFISDFWKSAKQRLYSGRYLTPFAEAKALQCIAVFYSMSDARTIERHHQQYLRRLIHAQNYVKRAPDTRFIPLPHIYFNVNNKYGFYGTRAWDKAWLDRKQNIASRNTYSRAIQEFKRNTAANKLSPIEVFRKSEQRIGKLGNEVLLQQFYQEVIQINNRIEQ